MAEKPILFSAPMVRAILEGRKTQTRRVVKKQPEDVGYTEIAPYATGAPWLGYSYYRRRKDMVWESTDPIKLRYAVGDRLWVRETWRWDSCMDDGYGDAIPPSRGMSYIEYKSDEWRIWKMHDLATVKRWRDNDECLNSDNWRPSIFMPRWASRITLEVTGVRVERLQSMTTGDALAEGIPEPEKINPIYYAGVLRDEFESLWDSINGKGSWDKNPWVEVYEFKVVNP